MSGVNAVLATHSLCQYQTSATVVAMAAYHLLRLPKLLTEPAWASIRVVNPAHTENSSGLTGRISCERGVDLARVPLVSFMRLLGPLWPIRREPRRPRVKCLATT